MTEVNDVTLLYVNFGPKGASTVLRDNQTGEVIEVPGGPITLVTDTAALLPKLFEYGLGPEMGQTPEIRIRLHYRALKRRWHFGDHTKGQLLLSLARRWKRPIREIKKIIRGEL